MKKETRSKKSRVNGNSSRSSLNSSALSTGISIWLLSLAQSSIKMSMKSYVMNAILIWINWLWMSDSSSSNSKIKKSLKMPCWSPQTKWSHWMKSMHLWGYWASVRDQHETQISSIKSQELASKQHSMTIYTATHNSPMPKKSTCLLNSRRAWTQSTSTS